MKRNRRPSVSFGTYIQLVVEFPPASFLKSQMMTGVPSYMTPMSIPVPTTGDCLTSKLCRTAAGMCDDTHFWPMGANLPWRSVLLLTRICMKMSCIRSSAGSCNNFQAIQGLQVIALVASQTMFVFLPN